MSRVRKNYENTFFGKVERWLEGDDTAFYHELEPISLEKQEKISGIQYYEYLEQIERTTMEYESVKKMHSIYRFIAGIMGVLIIAALMYAVYCMPTFGDPANPVNNEVSQRYIERGMEETGAVNIVAGMILDYRAYDTFGESNVLFIATSVVILLLATEEGKRKEKTRRELGMKRDVILQCICLMMVPLLMLFGIYIVLNGHLSPGGGFSGGAILGASLILFRNSYGYEAIQHNFSEKTLQMCTLMALGFYGLAKSYSFFTGANHLHSIISTGTPGRIVSAGLILPLNIAVGIVVACTMYSFYALFSKGKI